MLWLLRSPSSNYRFSFTPWCVISKGKYHLQTGGYSDTQSSVCEGKLSEGRDGKFEQTWHSIEITSFGSTSQVLLISPRRHSSSLEPSRRSRDWVTKSRRLKPPLSRQTLKQIHNVYCSNFPWLIQTYHTLAILGRSAKLNQGLTTLSKGSKLQKLLHPSPNTSATGKPKTPPLTNFFLTSFKKRW